jgi:hypothetical protein
MTKSNFTIKTDNKTGLRYETKTKDELTKNNWENDKGLVSGAMPESLFISMNNVYPLSMMNRSVSF